MRYELFPVPPEIVPVSGSITAPSVGDSAKLNVPPSTPIILAIAPSQVAVNSNEESSPSRGVILLIVVDGHSPFVV